jgi:hypothetical protein
MRRVKLKKYGNGGNIIAPSSKPYQNGEPEGRFNKTLTSVPENMANVEAEGGETALVPDINGLPAHYDIKGDRHHSGGVPLDLPEDSFVFSDTKDMKIKDPEILSLFDYSEGQTKNIKKSRGITPADIAKKYDINKYRETLENKNSTKLEVSTAELNIKNANLKLAQLALVQESMKGFPDGIPTAAMPFLAKFGIDPESLLPSPEEMMPEGGQEMMPQQQMPPGPPQQVSMAEDGLDVPADFKPDLLLDTKNISVDFDFAYKNGADASLALLGTAGYLAGTRNDRDMDQEIKNRSGADSLYADAEGSRGTYDQDGTFRPDQHTPVQFTGANTFAKHGGSLRSFIPEMQGGGQFNPEEGVYMTMQNGKEVYMDANDNLAPQGWSPDTAERIDDDVTMKYGGALPKAQTGGEKEKGTYENLVETFGGNQELAQKLYEKTIAALQNPKYLNRKALQKRGVNVEELINTLTPEMVLENFLSMQNRNHSVVKAKGANWIKTQKQSDPSTFNQVYEELGLGAPSDLEVALGQAAYLGYADLLKDNEAGRLDANTSSLLEPFRVQQEGAGDEKYGFDEGDDISRIDAIGTNTTVGQLAGLKKEPAPVIEDVVEKDVEEIPPGTVGETDQNEPPSGWYPQDKLNLANATLNRMSLKKYMPWTPQVDPVLPNPTFFDDRAAVANVMGAYNNANETLKTYATPQLASARASQVMGEAFQQSGNIIADVQAKNVATANQFETQRAGILNAANQSNAAQAVDLYDKVTVANQQFDNSKRDANAKMVTAMNAGITNSAYTDIMNDVYGDRFAINAENAGRLDFYNPPSKIDPAAQTKSMGDEFLALVKQFKGTGYSTEDLMKFYLESKKPQVSSNNDLSAILGAMPQAKHGGTKELKRVRLKRAPQN